MDALSLDRAKLQNDLLSAQISHINKSTTPSIATDRLPLDGQGDSYVTPLPMQPTATRPNALHAEPAGVSDIGYVRSHSGGLAVVPSKDAKDRMEDMIGPEIEWYFRNRLNPLVIFKGTPPPSTKDYKLPDNLDPRFYKWKWSPIRQEFIPSPRF